MVAAFIWLLRRRANLEEMRLLSVVFLVVLTLLPRLKPYSYVYAIIPTWLLFKDSAS
jgi:hypothetical protein